MGCISYFIQGRLIRFTEGNENFPCLCTFPHNDRAEGEFTIETLRSLALLGAAVVMASELSEEDDYIFIPRMLPDDIVGAIDSLKLGDK